MCSSDLSVVVVEDESFAPAANDIARQPPSLWGTPCSAPPPLAGDTLLPCLRIVAETFVVVVAVKNDDDAVFAVVDNIQGGYHPSSSVAAYLRPSAAASFLLRTAAAAVVGVVVVVACWLVRITSSNQPEPRLLS